MWLIFLMIFILLAVIGNILLPPSLGKVKPFLNEKGEFLEGSISEKTFIKINGTNQGMFIKGKDETKPVLLFVHGGPGMSDYFLAEQYAADLEDEFVVCYWEQRGTGLSYNPDIPLDTMNTEQFVSDVIEVTNYLRDRFRQDKIYLMGHSWGTYLGIKAAAQAPELYNAYIAMSQIVNQSESEKIAYTYMLEQYEKSGNTDKINQLLKYPIQASDESLEAYLNSSVRDNAMHELGIGTMHNMDTVIMGIFLPSLRCIEYTQLERINIWRGKAFSSQTDLRKEMYGFSAVEEIPELKTPVYFLAGKYDYTCCYSLQKEYFNTLKSPIKGFYTFEESAHSPLFEEPCKAKRILCKDVLNGIVTMADE
ncbi:alpha/beta hydrolase [Konateibacter massiliensis]|uniref:alpha/beta hydrolase n=1 Tax=Konateibacter massiliensis TaxID=2002841 RepID=UPI001F26F868|nr:alpha/beta hydrolase [Konateibacter massiliensis]